MNLTAARKQNTLAKKQKGNRINIEEKIKH